MRLIDEQFLETPWYGSRQMTRHLRRHGHEVNRKRVRRLIVRIRVHRNSSDWRHDTDLNQAQQSHKSVRETGTISLCRSASKPHAD
ncbi:Mobile element protein [Azospirillum palustre]